MYLIRHGSYDLTKAGSNATFAQTCSGICYNDYVIGSPSVYDNAYFEIGYLRVFSAAGSNTVVSPSTSGSAPASTSASASTNSALGLIQKHGSVMAFIFAVIGGLGVILL